MKYNHEKITHPRLLTVILMLLGALLLSGCGSSGGGGSDGGDNEPTIQTFNLYDPDYYTPGFQKGASELEGVDSDGTHYAGSYYIQTGDQITFQGQLAIPVTITQSLGKVGEEPVSNSMIIFYSTDDPAKPLMIVKDDGFTWTPKDPISPLPTIAEIGKDGDLTSYTGSNVEKAGLTETWELNEHAGGLADLVVTSVVTGTTPYTEVLTLTIDETGDYQSIQIITTIDPDSENPFTITQEGDFD